MSSGVGVLGLEADTLHAFMKSEDENPMWIQFEEQIDKTSKQLNKINTF